jgi:hypothetical protein
MLQAPRPRILLSPGESLQRLDEAQYQRQPKKPFAIHEVSHMLQKLQSESAAEKPSTAPNLGLGISNTFAHGPYLSPCKWFQSMFAKLQSSDLGS